MHTSIYKHTNAHEAQKLTKQTQAPAPTQYRSTGTCAHPTSIMLRQLLIRQWAIRILRRTWLLDRFLPRTTRSLKHSPRKSSRELCELENAVVAKDGQFMTNKEPQDCAIIKVRQDSIITTHTNVHTVHVIIE